MGALQVHPWPDAYDVVVVGAGPAGVAAMWECAREGAKVLIVDLQGFPGGAAAAGLCGLAGLHVSDCRISGIEDEFIRGLRERGGLLPANVAMVITSGPVTSGIEPPVASWGYLFLPEIAKQVMVDLIMAADAKVLLHAQTLGFIEEKGERRLVMAMKEGLRMVRAKVFIDATGARISTALKPSDQVFVAIGAQVRMKVAPKKARLNLPDAVLAGRYESDGLLIQAAQGVLYSNPLDDEFGHLRLLGQVLLSSTCCKNQIRQDSVFHSLGFRLLHTVLDYWKRELGEKVELLTASPVVYVTPGSPVEVEVGTQLKDAAALVGTGGPPVTGRSNARGDGLLQGDFSISVWRDSWRVRSPFAALEPMGLPYRALLASVPGVILAGGALAAKFRIACTALPISFAFATGQAAGRLAVHCLENGLEDIWANGRA